MGRQLVEGRWGEEGVLLRTVRVGRNRAGWVVTDAEDFGRKTEMMVPGSGEDGAELQW